MFYLFAILFLTTVSGQTSSTGKIKNEPTDNSGNSPNSGDQNYQYNQGIQPYSYGYNTGIKPYSYSYTQNGDKPQVTYHNLPMQQYSAQPMPGMVPFQPYYGNGAGYPMPMQYGYPPMQPMPYQPMPMNGSPPPTIPPIPDLTGSGLPNLGADFDLSNLGTPQGKSNTATSSNNPNNFGDFNMDNLGQNDASNSNTNANNNNSPSTDLNSELANLADPSSVSGTNSNNKNNNANQGLPTGLGDFNIDGLSSNVPANNNNNNNAFSGLPQDILGQFNTNNNNKNENGNANDFSDLSSLANLANNAGGSVNPNTNQDFNFGGSNNNLDFDLNIPSASNIIEKALEIAKKDPKKIFSKKQINENLKKAVNKRLMKVIEKPINKQIDKLLKRKRRSINSFKAEESSISESSYKASFESPKKMLNLDPRHQNPYQGVYSSYFAYGNM